MTTDVDINIGLNVDPSTVNQSMQQIARTTQQHANMYLSSTALSAQRLRGYL